MTGPTSPGARGRACAVAAALALVGALASMVAGCGRPTELTFRITAPQNSLLDPFSLPVSDYVLKTDQGSIVAAVSAGSAKDEQGRLALGALDPALAGLLRLDVLSGSQLIGLARVRDVRVAGGETVELVADVRKPLVIVGSAAVPEGAGAHQATRLLDPTTSTDLADRGLMLPDSAAAGFTADGRTLIVASGGELRTIDTGTGAAGGPTSLPFSPSLLALAPRDGALALVERAAMSSRVVLYSDVDVLLANPSTTPVTAMLSSGLPRAAHFSPDGSMLYVLVEDAAAEPCTGATPAANQLVPIDASGTVHPAIALPSYVADFAIDRDGRFILAEAGADQISIMTLSFPDGSGGVAAPVRLYAATCPTALRLLEDQVFVVTNDASSDVGDAFALLRGRLDGSQPARLPIVRPSYETQLNSSSTRDKLTRLNLEFVSTAVAASEMAVSPDGNRAVIATRVRYREHQNEPFDFLGLTCKAEVDIVEHGLYSIDLVNGTASYTTRSQNTVVPANPADVCVSCEADLGGFPPVIVGLDLDCPSRPGDRAAGLAAAFSGAP